MKRLAIAGVVVGSLLMAGCAPKPSITSQLSKYEVKAVSLPSFPLEEYEKLVIDGKQKLSGQAFMKTVGGDVKTGAGGYVVLLPKTSYTDFQYKVYSTGSIYETEDARAAKYERITTADANGNFEFSNIAAGDYYIQTVVRWMRPSSFGLLLEGGLIMTPVTVKNGENKVIVTR